MSAAGGRLTVPRLGLDNGLDLWVHGVHYPAEQAFSILVFIDQPDANADTPTEGNPHYAGRGVVMARTHFPEAIALGALPWADPSIDREHDPPLSFRMDVLEQIREVAPQGGEVDVSLVLVDARGGELPDELLTFDRVEFQIRGDPLAVSD